jgi:drebrin-like protein
MASLRAGKSDSTSSATPEVIRGSYTPIGKVDIAAIRAQAKEQEQHSQSQSSQPRQQRPPEPDRDTYVGTSGYKPVQLPPPKPLGGGTSKFGPSITSRGGTVAPIPTGPVKESKAIGGASKNFGADASGKTPSQLWAERKARERGQIPGHGVIPDIAPQKPLSRGTEPPVSPGTYVEDSAAVIGTGGASGGVKAMRDRFARQSIGDEDSGALPISPGRGPPPRKDFSSRMAPSPPSPPSPPAAPSPPPVAVSSKPPPRTYQSLDHVVSAGAGAGVGLGVGVLASQAMHHEEEPEEDHEPEPTPRSPSPPPPAPSRDTWATSAEQDPVSEDEEDMAARQQSQMHAEHTYEPEPETDHEQHHQEQEVSRLESGAQSSKSAVVLFEYEAQEENEISLIEGQIITNIEFIDDVRIPFLVFLISPQSLCFPPLFSISLV